MRLAALLPILLAAAPAGAAAAAVVVTVDGQPAAVGSFAWPSGGRRIGLSNGLFSAAFDVEAPSSWPGAPSISLASLVVNGSELARNLAGAAGDPDAGHSFFVSATDAAGAQSRLACSRVDVLRAGADLAEVAFVDAAGGAASGALRHELHLVVRAGVAGVYGFLVTSAAEPVELSEVRVGFRFDRAQLDHAYNDARGAAQQPTSAYLALMPSVYESFYTVNGSNAPGLPSPDSNGGNLPAGYNYSRFLWAVYPSASTMWGHFGHGLGAFHVPLSGATGNASAASYGMGPQQQGLSAVEDALILDSVLPARFSAKNFLAEQGYRRLFGPWLTLLATGDAADPAGLLASARTQARAEANASVAGLAWMQHELYAGPENRSTVVGFIELEDGRGYKRYTALITPDARNETDVYSLRAPTYWAVGDSGGKFAIPSVPAGSGYTLFLFTAAPAEPTEVQSASPSVLDVFVQRDVGVLPGGGVSNLGALIFKPSDSGFVRIWRVGWSDRSGAEFGLANGTREFALGDRVPANLHFHCDTFDRDGRLASRGSDQARRLGLRRPYGQDPTVSFPYAQTKPGSFLFTFEGGHTFVGNVSFFLQTSMRQGKGVTATLNGVPFTGEMEAGVDDPLSLGAVRGARTQLTVLHNDAALIVPELNNVTLDLPDDSGGGIGWDVITFAVFPSQ